MQNKFFQILLVGALILEVSTSFAIAGTGQCGRNECLCVRPGHNTQCDDITMCKGLGGQCANTAMTPAAPAMTSAAPASTSSCTCPATSMQYVAKGVTMCRFMTGSSPCSKVGITK